GATEQKLGRPALPPAVPRAGPPGVLASVATFGFGVVGAATQIGVATTLIDIRFVGIVGALALAFGLGFGLGGRDEAARVWHDMRGTVGNVATERPQAVGTTAGNGRPFERSEQRVRT